MPDLNNIEADTLQAVKMVAGTYQTYSENFIDAKYAEINTCFITPLVNKVGSLMTAFEEINRTVKTMKNKGVITEES